MHVQPPRRTALVRDHFLADHKRLDSLLERLVVAAAGADRAEIQRLWRDLDSGMIKHLATEESLLIPALFRVSERDARVLVQEHRHIRTWLTEIATEVAANTLSSNALRNFIDELRAHSRNEQKVLYQWADEHMDDSQISSAIAALTQRGEANTDSSAATNSST